MITHQHRNLSKFHEASRKTIHHSLVASSTKALVNDARTAPEEQLIVNAHLDGSLQFVVSLSLARHTNARVSLQVEHI